MKIPAFKITSLLLAFVFSVSIASTPLFGADPQTPTDPDICYKEAKALADQGKHEEALQKYLWCYDHGVEVNPKFARTRDTRVTVYMVSLGKKYPAAREALIERRAAAVGKIKAEPEKADKALLQQLAYLDLAVGDDAAILETLKLFAVGKGSYRAYGSVMQERLVEGKHYREAAAAEDVGEVIEMLEKTVRNVEKMREAGKFDEKAAEKLKGNAVKAAPGVEMYAGIGDTKHAKQLADLLLELSDNPEVRGKIVERLRRAGAEDLAKKYEKKK